MKKNRGKIIFIFFCIVVSAYFLYPTFKDYEFTKKIRSLTGDTADSVKYADDNDSAIRDARAKR
ncbi:MAG TPA: hypothetical protein VKS81_02145, partial [Bacteroidota bacterium]|nr:hypothetical protein [Bacteroidota bacterium]